MSETHLLNIRSLKCVFHPKAKIIHAGVISHDGKTYNRYVCGYKKGCHMAWEIEVNWQEGRRWD